MKSMTGFAHHALSGKGLQGTISLKSYNNRFLDIAISLPPSISGIEPHVRDFLGSRISRGKIECAIRARKIEASLDDIVFHAQSALVLAEQLRGLARECGIDENLSLDTITRFPGIIEMNSEIDELSVWESIMPSLEEAWREFEESRLREGLATQSNIASELTRLRTKLSEIETQASALEKIVHDQITARFKELLGENYDQGRVLQEVAVQLVRLTINEEIERLKAHFSAFDYIAAQPSCGKKLDFLCQEMNREVNTIGSKSMIVSISHAVVEMKDALENIREQLRNVE